MCTFSILNQRFYERCSLRVSRSQARKVESIHSLAKHIYRVVSKDREWYSEFGFSFWLLRSNFIFYRLHDFCRLNPFWFYLFIASLFQLLLSLFIIGCCIYCIMFLKDLRSWTSWRLAIYFFLKDTKDLAWKFWNLRLPQWDRYFLFLRLEKPTICCEDSVSFKISTDFSSFFVVFNFMCNHFKCKKNVYFCKFLRKIIKTRPCISIFVSIYL